MAVESRKSAKMLLFFFTQLVIPSTRTNKTYNGFLDHRGPFYGVYDVIKNYVFKKKLMNINVNLLVDQNLFLKLTPDCTDFVESAVATKTGFSI